MENLRRPYSSFIMLLLVTSLVGSCIIYLLPHLILRTGASANVVGPSMLAVFVAPLIWTVVIDPMRKRALSEIHHTRTTLENVVDAVINFDERGNIEAFNAGAETMFGYGSGEVRGLKVADIIPKYISCFSESSETVVYHRNGTSFPAEVYVSKLHVGRRSSYVAIVHDISERKRVEQSVRESEKRYRSLFRNMLNGIAYWKMLVDASGKPYDFVYLDVNDAFSKLTGLQDVIGKRLTEVLPALQKSYDQLFEIYARVTVTGQAEKFEVFVEDLDLWFFISVFSPQPLHLVTVFENITDRKLAEKEIVKAQSDWERTFDAIIDPVMILDTEHRIVKANKAVAAELGALPCNLEGTRCCNWVHKSNDAPCGCPHVLLLQDGKPHSGEVHDQRQGKYFQVVVSPLYGPGGELQGSIHFSRDITQQKNLEKQLQHAQKMQAVGTLAGGVAHDFNNVLTAIIGYGTLVQMRLGTDDPAAPQISALLDAADRASDLTRSLLTFSREAKVMLQPCNLNEIILQGRKMLGRLIREDIEIDTELAEDALNVMVDRRQIEQVLMNLAINAQDAIIGAGSVSITTATLEMDEQFIMREGYGVPGRYAALEVSDSGQGMDEETRERIFEPFFTTKIFGKGTGLGLAIVYGIVKQHGGFITCNSRPGAGTTFQIYLPMGLKGPEQQVAASQLPLPTGTETILVVEDDEQTRGVLRDILARFGYDVVTAADGEEAVAVLHAREGRVDLAVLDAVMPKLNGREAYQQMQQMNPELKAVFTSGYPEANKDIADAGITCLTKPIIARDLLRAVRSSLG